MSRMRQKHQKRKGNTMGYKLAIFDMDGTILNTLDDLAASTNYALKANGMPGRTTEEVCSFVGNGIQKLIERASAPGSSEAQKEQVLATFKDYYKDHCADKTRPYDGIMDLLATLRKKGILTAVVSNKGDFAVQILCQDYFPDMFDFAVGEKEGIRRKPAPDSVQAVLDKFQIDKKDAVYIGDSEVDIQTGANAGMKVIAVDWGFRTEEFLKESGADCIVHTMEELLKKIV